MTSYDDSLMKKKSSDTNSSPISTSIFVRDLTHRSELQLATLMRRFVGVIRRFNLCVIFQDITLSSAPQSKIAELDSEHILTRTTKCLNIDRPWTSFLWAKLTDERIERPESIFS